MNNEVLKIIKNEVNTLEERLKKPGINFTKVDFNNRLYGFLKGIKSLDAITSAELSDLYFEYSK